MHTIHEAAERAGLFKTTTRKATTPVKKERAFHFRRVTPGFYISNRKAGNGQHVTIEKRHNHWVLGFAESGEISRHGSVKACKFALETLIAGDDSLVTQ